MKQSDSSSCSDSILTFSPIVCIIQVMEYLSTFSRQNILPIDGVVITQ